MTRSDIAIIGMACLFPDAPDLASFWQNIVTKVDAITDPPAEAWDAEIYYDPDSTTNDRVYCKKGGFIGPLAHFDPVEYGIMPLALHGGEPDQWLALHVAHAALKDAGYDGPFPERHRTAVILGKGTYLSRGNLSIAQHGTMVDQTLKILKTLHPEYTQDDLDLIKSELKKGLPPFNPDTVSGLIPNIIAGRIANKLDLMGPSFTVDAACASSLLALDIAVRGLRNHEYDLALVGGAQVTTPIPISLIFAQLGALSRREQIRPFDQGADGTILGEGVGMVVLKRLEHAQRDGQRIYAVIKGVGVASDGRGVSVTAPRLEGEVMALQRAYQQADISPETINLIEAHGTATVVGDPIEIQALTQVFGTRDGAFPHCGLGSVKSMIGHLMPAAGIASLIKTALALYHRVLPPTLNVEQPNPALELEKTPFYINNETRPWIHGGRETPRRAGINAFGFGGINAHVILEETSASEPEGYQSHHLLWDDEVFLLRGESRAELLQQADQLQQFLSTNPEISFKDLAFTLNTENNATQPMTLALVAGNAQDLSQKLARASSRLSDPACSKIKEVQGIYFFEQALAQSGRLAFMFPGEGSQYPNMLADLCIHFPVVRQVFDLVDRALSGNNRALGLGELVFPWPSFSEKERRAAVERLWHMQTAVEALFPANLALYRMLSSLELRPDCLVGHSSGEYSAMLVAGMIDLSDEARLSQFSAELSNVQTQAAKTPQVALLAVSASVQEVTAITEQWDGDLYLAMDNCPHQSVLVCGEGLLDEVSNKLHDQGIIFERLAFDRPYHSQLFEDFSTRLREAFQRWLLKPPAIETYSCTTAAPFPKDIDQIQELAASHWALPVRFRETIQAMYQDGVRIFVEVGPRGNLSAFVDDILRGQPHLAVPADLMQRSGTTQLNHLAAMLAAHSVPIKLDKLYAYRSPTRLDLSKPNGSSKREPKRVKLATKWPTLELSEETATSLRPRPTTDRPQIEEILPIDTPPPTLRPAQMPAEPMMSAHLQTMSQFLSVQEEIMQAYLSNAIAAPTSAAIQQPTQEPDQTPAAPPEPVEEKTYTPTSTTAITEILLQLVSKRTGYPAEMLDLNLDLEADLGIDSIKRVEILGSFQQQTGLLKPEEMEVLTGRKTLQEMIDYLTTRPQRSVVDSPQTPTEPDQEKPPHPLVDQVISLTPGEALTARYSLEREEALFMSDHTLGRHVSESDPDLRGLPVLPLTVSMEMLAEAVSILLPEQLLIGMKDIRAYRWITLEQETLTLELVAKRHAQQEVFVQIREPESQSTYVEGIARFDHHYPETPVASELTLADDRPSRWQPEQLYQQMFHGPAFRGVASMDRWGSNGAKATLEVLPHDKLLRSIPNPDFLTDPILLDQPGQVVGFWTADHLETGFLIFPFRLDALHLYGPPPQASQKCQCHARIKLVGETQVRSDLDIVGNDNTIYARFEGWQDLRFELPDALYHSMLSPKGLALSKTWSMPTEWEAAIADIRLVHLGLDDFAENLFTDHGNLWLKVLAHLILSRREREMWQQLRTPVLRRLEWLLGRVATKENVRQFLSEKQHLMLCLADIEIIPDEKGRPLVTGAWIDQVPSPPTVSIAHSDGTAVSAVMADKAGVGVDIERADRENFDLESLAFNPEEQALLSGLPEEKRAEWALRFWCAKEAAAKALGRGLDRGPLALTIQTMALQTGIVQLITSKDPTQPTTQEEPQTAFTTRSGDLILAVCTQPLKEDITNAQEP